MPNTSSSVRNAINFYYNDEMPNNMKMQNPIREVPFDDLIDPSKSMTDKVVLLNPDLGSGSVQIFNLEKGLQARVWDFFFPDDIELYNQTHANVEKPYFTLAYFWITQGMPLIKASSSDQEYVLLDRLFLYALSEYKMYIPRITRGYCFSVSFSKRWLCEVLKGNKTLEKVKRKICKADVICMAEMMTQAERTLIEELVTISWQKQLGSFYIKTTVLKILSNFLVSLKEQGNFHTSKSNLGAAVAQVERYLVKDVTGGFPSLQELVRKFPISISTLNRKFKTRYGTTMTAYFYRHKMKYAKDLIQEKGLSVAEAAYMVGYRSTQNFIRMFTRYYDLNFAEMCI